MGRSRILLAIVSTGLVWSAATSPSCAADANGQILRPTTNTTNSAPTLENALFLFRPKVRDIDLVVGLRSQIERAGGRVHEVLGLTGIIAVVTPESFSRLAAFKGVLRAYTGPAATAPQEDAPTYAAIATWNKILTPSHVLAKQVRNALVGDAFIARDLPSDAAQLKALQASYDAQWRVQRTHLPARMRFSNDVGCHRNGAGYVDTSLYMAGDFTVGVYYENGPGGGWSQSGSATTASMTQTFADIGSSLNDLIGKQPNARITFTLVSEVDSSGNPLPPPTNERTDDNNLRNAWCTDWAFLVHVMNGGMTSAGYASIQGPSMHVDRTSSIFDYAVEHEFGHVSGAYDEYAPFGPTPLAGYLRAPNANACGSDTNGYFLGAGECLDDLMAGWSPTAGYNTIVGVFTAEAFGWLDSDGNGILDVAETKPLIDSATTCNPSGTVFTCHGTATDHPVWNQMGSPYGNVSINSVTAVQYRMNSGAWQDVAADDGVFDSNSESFTFSTPPLPNGTYTLQIRAINTVGAVTPFPLTQLISMTGSAVTNARPFASLIVRPDLARAGTVISASGGGSTDLEGGPLQYNFNWGSGWTGYTSNWNSTNSALGPGTYPVQMMVRDAGVPSLTHLLWRNITLVAGDTPPVIALSLGTGLLVSTPTQNYSVYGSLQNSFDAETPYSSLVAEWDTDCSGTWTTGAKTKSLALTNSHYGKSDRHCVSARLTDNDGSYTDAQRYVFDVPYDHAPTISAVTISGVSPIYTVTVNAQDADRLTTWDGMVEYQIDFENDGIWDTPFGSSNTFQVPAANINTFTVRVRDRFFATATWNVACANPTAC